MKPNILQNHISSMCRATICIHIFRDALIQHGNWCICAQAFYSKAPPKITTVEQEEGILYCIHWHVTVLNLSGCQFWMPHSSYSGYSFWRGYVTNKKSGGPLESRIIRSLHIQRAWKIWGGIGIVMLFQSYALINYLSQSLPETDMPKTAQEGIDFSGTRGLKIWKSDVGSATLPKNPESCSTTKNTI